MKFSIRYNKESLSLSIEIGQYYKSLQCPFATWWKARKYFKRPKFKFYFGPMWKYKGKIETKFGKHDDYEYKGGYWPFMSTNYLKWYTPKWFPIHVVSRNIGWKDKYDVPQYERPGYFIIFFGRDYWKHWQFSMVVTAPKFFCRGDCTRFNLEDFYWESMLYFTEYCDKDLIKTRERLNDNSWTTTKVINVPDFKVIDSRIKSLFNTKYYVLKVESEQLYDLCYDYPNFSVNNVAVIEKKDDETTHFEHGSYTYCIGDNLVEIWIRVNPNFYEFTNVSKIEYIKTLDLGPTFRDEYLTKRAIKEVKAHYENLRSRN